VLDLLALQVDDHEEGEADDGGNQEDAGNAAASSAQPRLVFKLPGAASENGGDSGAPSGAAQEEDANQGDEERGPTALAHPAAKKLRKVR
jgi:hypothetical protein